MRITPARPSDLDPVRELFERTSAESRRRRFHGAVRSVPSRYLYAAICGAPGVIARVAREDGRVIALATAVPETADRVELAVWVDDAWQHRGIGTRVLREVIDQLLTDGIRCAVAYLEPDNTASLALARSLARQLGAPPPTAPIATFDLTATREVSA
jgi:RimJ/RimL family protein N-acetyltransferase